MSEPINDNDRHIEQLLHNLGGGYWPEKHAALVALVEERNELAARCMVQHDLLIAMGRSDREIHPADRDRDLRERLVCAALQSIAGMSLHGLRWDECGKAAAECADAALAAMRKGDANG